MCTVGRYIQLLGINFVFLIFFLWILQYHLYVPVIGYCSIAMFFFHKGIKIRLMNY